MAFGLSFDLAVLCFPTELDPNHINCPQSSSDHCIALNAHLGGGEGSRGRRGV